MATIVACPGCGVSVQVPPELLGHQVKCGICGKIFTPQAGTALPQPPPVPEPDAIPRRPYRRRYVYDDDDWEGRQEWEQEMRRRARARALEKTQGPAILLLVAGCFMLLCGLLGILGLIYAYQAAVNGNLNEEDPIILAVAAALGAVFGLIGGVVVVAGGLSLKQHRSYALAMTGSIMAMLFAIMFCTPAAVVGVWPLVVLSDKDVQELFRSRATAAESESG